MGHEPGCGQQFVSWPGTFSSMSPEPQEDRTQATLIDLADDAEPTHKTSPSASASHHAAGNSGAQDSPGHDSVNDSFAAHSYGDAEAHAPTGTDADPVDEPLDTDREPRTHFGPFSKMLNAAARVQAAPAQLANIAETANDVLTAAKNNPSMLTDLVRLEVERGVGALGLVTPTDFVALRKRVRDAEREAAKAHKSRQELQETVQSLALRLAQVEQELVDLKNEARTGNTKASTRTKAAKKTAARKSSSAKKATTAKKTAASKKAVAQGTESQGTVSKGTSATAEASATPSSDAASSPSSGRQTRTSL